MKELPRIQAIERAEEELQKLDDSSSQSFDEANERNDDRRKK